MDRAEAYRERAVSTSVDEFATLLPPYFLVKQPSPTRRTGSARPPSWECDFATSAVPIGGDPGSEAMELSPVRKRPGNPFPERITIGRASNCDVVWRYPCVSKVHAHLVPQGDGGLSVEDRGAANFTWVNGRKLAPREMVKLEVGDVLGLGSISLELYTVQGLHELLSAMAPATRLARP